MNGHCMPLESLKPVQENRFGVLGKSVVLCSLNVPDFFGINTGQKQATHRVGQ